MKLRIWQSHCIELAMQYYKAGRSHFLCLATPGAGKTLMASILAKRLIGLGLIDLVVCISPSKIVSEDFRDELEAQLKHSLNGRLGSLGKCMTYQGILTEAHLWPLFESHRVFVIFDEIHHCSGDDINNSNAWGERIISKIQGRAKFTLALTGTPWRSDNIPITLGNYSENGKILCDYSYGLSQAITDNVCRTPVINIIDNDRIIVKKSDISSHVKSFKELMKDHSINYQQLIENVDLIKHCLLLANSKLNSIRQSQNNAGGLIVATSVVHAKFIQEVLIDSGIQDSLIVTYAENDPVNLIQRFKHSDSKWIISVGMISEGTNIPRLRVCCYLTRVKTELYFRQVLGRVLRSTNPNEQGFLYMPAEPTLVEYAYNIKKDIPDAYIFRNNEAYLDKNVLAINSIHGGKDNCQSKFEIGYAGNESVEIDFTKPGSETTLSKNYQDSIDLYGQFHEKAIKLLKNSILCPASS